jgi:tetratricopeptide (TPR) repeat protein
LGDIKRALKSLEKASRLAVSSPGLRTAIDTLRAEAHRKDGSLAQFLKELEASAETPGRLELLGRLQEEEGNTEGAISAYEKGLARSPSDIDLRLRLVRLYEVTGDIESAVKEYGLLAKSSPRDVQLSLRYAEMLLAQGKRNHAVAELDRIERLTTNDAEAGLLLLDFAERLEEKQRSQNILARLSRSSATDARFLVELGSRYYQKGDTETAHKTWKRLITLGGDRAKGYLTYGEVLIDHEAVTEGVRRFVKPTTWPLQILAPRRRSPSASNGPLPKGKTARAKVTSATRSAPGRMSLRRAPTPPIRALL